MHNLQAFVHFGNMDFPTWITTQAIPAIERYVASHPGTLSPVSDNLQPPSNAPHGEVIFPLVIQTADFNPGSPHWIAGLVLFDALSPVMEACDRALADKQSNEYQVCRLYNEMLRQQTTSVRHLTEGLHSPFLSMKLTVNDSQGFKHLTSNHQSPFCVMIRFGDFTGGTTDTRPQLPLNRARDATTNLFLLPDTHAISVGRFQGTRYQLEFFVPPVS